MAEARIISFQAEHEAYLAAHQLQHEGSAAFVFGYSLASSPWPGLGFRVLTFPPDEERREDGEDAFETDLTAPAFIGEMIDRLLRVMCFGAISLFPVLLIFFLLKKVSLAGPEPLLTVDHIAPIGIVILIWIAAGLAMVPIYHGYRKGNLACVVLFRIAALPIALMRFDAAVAGTVVLVCGVLANRRRAAGDSRD